MSWAARENPYLPPQASEARMVSGPGLKYVAPLLNFALYRARQLKLADVSEAIHYHDYDYQQWSVREQRWEKIGKTHQLVHYRKRPYRHGEFLTHPACPYGWGNWESQKQDDDIAWRWKSVDLDAQELMPIQLSEQEIMEFEQFCQRLRLPLQRMANALADSPDSYEQQRITDEIKRIHYRLNALANTAAGGDQFDPSLCGMYYPHTLAMHLVHDMKEYVAKHQPPQAEQLQAANAALMTELDAGEPLLEKMMHHALYRHAERGLPPLKKSWSRGWW